MSASFEHSNLEDLAAAFIRIRDTKAAIQHAADSQIEPLDASLTQIKKAMAEKLASVGAKSVKTAAGTIYSTVKRYANVGDWGVFHEWIIEHRRLDFLQRRTSNPAITQYIEENKEVPSGLAIVSEEDIGVRKN
jgi:hypothetical protein